MHWVVALAVVVVAAPAPPPKPSTVTHDLSDRARAKLVGCWISRDHETWTFRESGDHGLEVVRDSSDTRDLHRPVTASSVMYDPTPDSFAFVTAGRIHGLMMIFALDRDHARISASVFSKHDERGYFFTGNNLALTRCPAK
jgi:hypothetical protein